MSPEQDRARTERRLTALRLVRCLGSRNAMEYCRNNQWQGLYEIIRDMSGSQAVSR